MPAIIRTSILGTALALAATAASADTVIEQAAEHRFQLDFHVNDAALQKMLPAGWEPAIAAMGPAKDCNLRVIFIDRMAVVGADGKPAGKGTSRLAYIAIPVKQTGGMSTGQMIIGGLTEDAADAPGPFGNYRHATSAKMVRSQNSSGGTMTGEEDWDLAAADGEHLQVHVKYERGPVTKGGAETKFYDPANPAKYQIFKTEQGIDITRNTTTNPPDHVKEFSYKMGGGRIAALFDGNEKVLSWDSFPWYNRTVIAP
jgi:hypothetical protein